MRVRCRTLHSREEIRLIGSPCDLGRTPGAQRLPLSGGQPSIGVDEALVPGRHLALRDLVGALTKLLGALRGVVRIPGGEVELTPSLLDVVYDEPRDRSHPAVPGPGGFTRMAVVAGAAQERVDLGWS